MHVYAVLVLGGLRWAFAAAGARAAAWGAPRAGALLRGAAARVFGIGVRVWSFTLFGCLVTCCNAANAASSAGVRAVAVIWALIVAFGVPAGLASAQWRLLGGPLRELVVHGRDSAEAVLADVVSIGADLKPLPLVAGRYGEHVSLLARARVALAAAGRISRGCEAYAPAAALAPHAPLLEDVRFPAAPWWLLMAAQRIAAGALVGAAAVSPAAQAAGLLVLEAVALAVASAARPYRDAVLGRILIGLECAEMLNMMLAVAVAASGACVRGVELVCTCVTHGECVCAGSRGMGEAYAVVGAVSHAVVLGGFLARAVRGACGNGRRARAAAGEHLAVLRLEAAAARRRRREGAPQRGADDCGAAASAAGADDGAAEGWQSNPLRPRVTAPGAGRHSTT